MFFNGIMCIIKDVYIESCIRPWYNSANFAGPSKGTLHATCNYVKTLGFFYIKKMNTTLFQIYVKFIGLRDKNVKESTHSLSHINI